MHCREGRRLAQVARFQLPIHEFADRREGQRMAATDNFLKSSAALHDHDAQAAGIRVQFLFIQDHADRKGSLFSA